MNDHDSKETAERNIEQIEEWDPTGYPTPGDRLFSDKVGPTTAHLKFGSSAWNSYIIGYRQAAYAALEPILNGENSYMDALVFPIVALFRHYLELRLKMLHVHLTLLDNKEPYAIGHNLSAIWEKIEPHIKQRGAGQSTLSAVGDLFSEFQKIDPKADGFRYTETLRKVEAEGGAQTDGRKPKPKPKKVLAPTLVGLEQVDLLNLKLTMEKIESFLDACDHELGEEVDHLTYMTSLYGY